MVREDGKKMFDIKEFNENFESGEKFALDYVYNTIIKHIDTTDFDELENEPKKNRDLYLVNLWRSANSLNECLWLYEDYTFNNNFNFDTYSLVRDKLFEEIGLEFIDGQWKEKYDNELYKMFSTMIKNKKNDNDKEGLMAIKKTLELIPMYVIMKKKISLVAIDNLMKEIDL